MKRKKRLEKGVQSIEEEIEIHKKKMQEAKEEGNLELVDYYNKEISGLEKTKDRNGNQLEKS